MIATHVRTRTHRLKAHRNRCRKFMQCQYNIAYTHKCFFFSLSSFCSMDGITHFALNSDDNAEGDLILLCVRNSFNGIRNTNYEMVIYALHIFGTNDEKNACASIYLENVHWKFKFCVARPIFCNTHVNQYNRIFSVGDCARAT